MKASFLWKTRCTSWSPRCGLRTAGKPATRCAWLIFLSTPLAGMTCTYASTPRTPPQPWACAKRLRSEEHTSELQSLRHLVCRLLLEKKNQNRHVSVGWVGEASSQSQHLLQVVLRQ